MTGRLLVLEADTDLRIILGITLREAGYRCDLADIEVLNRPRRTRREWPPLAAIVLGMPGAHVAGIALSRAANARWPGTPLVVLVSDRSPRVHDACLAAGAAAVIAHPFTRDELTDTIHWLLGDGPAAPTRNPIAEAERPADMTAEPATLSSSGSRRGLSPPRDPHRGR